MSKHVFDVAFVEQGSPTYLGQFTNCCDGFADMVRTLEQQTGKHMSKWFICFENTGVYSKELLEWLYTHKIAYLEENPLKINKSLGLRRGKNDKVDSLAICRYVFEKRDAIQPSSYTPLVIKHIRQLLSRRKLLMRQINALKVSLKEQKIVLDDELFNELEQDNNLLIREYTRQIDSIKEKVESLIDQDEQIKKNHELAQSVIGIGFQSSVMMIAYTNNFKGITEARKFACYAGVAPFSNQSGKFSGRDKVSHMANKDLKAQLFTSSMSAIRYDPQIKRYFNRKKREGKNGFLVLNAVKNKLIQRVYAVIKRQQPYVKLGHFG